MREISGVDDRASDEWSRLRIRLVERQCARLVEWMIEHQMSGVGSVLD